MKIEFLRRQLTTISSSPEGPSWTEEVIAINTVNDARDDCVIDAHHVQCQGLHRTAIVYMTIIVFSSMHLYPFNSAEDAIFKNPVNQSTIVFNYCFFTRCEIMFVGDYVCDSNECEDACMFRSNNFLKVQLSALVPYVIAIKVINSKMRSFSAYNRSL